MVMPTLDKIIVTVNFELFISNLIIGNSMERILHGPYHSWVPQAWVTCYFAHEWNKMQIILLAIRGTALIEGTCMVMKEYQVGFIFSDVRGMIFLVPTVTCQITSPLLLHFWSSFCSFSDLKEWLGMIFTFVGDYVKLFLKHPGTCKPLLFICYTRRKQWSTVS